MLPARFLVNILASVIFLVTILVPRNAIYTGSEQDISPSKQSLFTPLSENTNPLTPCLPKFIINIEYDINSQFDCWEYLKNWYNTLKLMYAYQSPTEKVIIGKDNWLFLTEPNQVADHQGLSILSEEALQAWTSIFTYRQAWLAERGILYVLVIAPDKKSVYAEYYPDQYPVIYENNTQLDQLLTYLRQNSDLVILDLRIPLIAHKPVNPEGELLYYTADTHWTQTGALIAYRWIVEQLQGFFPQLTHADDSDLNFRPLENPLQGNLDALDVADKSEYQTHTYSQVCYSSSVHCNQLTETDDCQEIDYTYSYQNEATRQYQCDSQSVNAIIFYDSFGVALYPHFMRTFENTLLIRRPGRFWLISDEFEALLDTTHPNIVIDEMIERSFTNPPHPSRVPPVE